LQRTHRQSLRSFLLAAELDIVSGRMLSTSAPPSGSTWSASVSLRRSLLLSIATIAIGAWGGAAAYLTEHFELIPVFLAFVPFYFVVQHGLLKRLEAEPGLQPEQRERYVSQVKVYGPAGLLQLAIRIYFPSSQLGGR
jgi:hypothetical protein